MKKPLLFIIAILIIGGIIAGILFFSGNSQQDNPGQAPTATPIPNDVESTRLIEEKDLGFSLRLPDEFVIEKNGDYSRIIKSKINNNPIDNTSFIYISVVPNGRQIEEGSIYNYSKNDLSLLKSIQQGEKRILSNANNDMASYFTYERIDGLMLGGYGAKAFKNPMPWEFPSGTSEYRYLVEFEEATYIIGFYVQEKTGSGNILTKSGADQILTTLKLTPGNIKDGSSKRVEAAEWKKFTSLPDKISFDYPENWTQNPDSQNFPGGDIFSLTVIGQTQRTQTELYDGLSFAVMKPVNSDLEIDEWVKNQYANSTPESDRPNQYSKVSFGNVVYEKTIICGLGCFTYYHTKQNGRIYGFVVNAVGPHAAYYESIISRVLSSIKYLK